MQLGGGAEGEGGMESSITCPSEHQGPQSRRMGRLQKLEKARRVIHP